MSPLVYSVDRNSITSPPETRCFLLPVTEMLTLFRKFRTCSIPVKPRAVVIPKLKSEQGVVRQYIRLVNDLRGLHELKEINKQLMKNQMFAKQRRKPSHQNNH